MVDETITVPRAGRIAFTFSGRFGQSTFTPTVTCITKGTNAVEAAPVTSSDRLLASGIAQIPIVGNFAAAAGVNRIQIECISSDGTVNIGGWQLNGILTDP
ncbi:MAG: hypothetical protein JHC46_06505 [Solirubrobacteraceae bacterium]|nr:hypothetical protein [Solirubrobacteraceae bacterium]